MSRHSCLSAVKEWKDIVSKLLERQRMEKSEAMNIKIGHVKNRYVKQNPADDME